MSKAVLLSIRPRWCGLIASGKKTIEVRKTRTKLDTPFRCYIYCTQGKHNLNVPYSFYGNVIGEFVCDEIIEYDCIWGFEKDKDCYYNTCSFDEDYTCLTDREMGEYGKGAPLFGWHISDLVIYDEPKPLQWIYRYCGMFPQCDLCGDKCPVRCRPPRSWCYVEELT